MGLIKKNVWADDGCNFSLNCVMKVVLCDRVALVFFFCHVNYDILNLDHVSAFNKYSSYMYVVLDNEHFS